MGTTLSFENLVPHTIDKAMVTSAFERLGADKVMRGHIALLHGEGGNWNNCFLAMCFGGYGKLQAMMNTLEPLGLDQTDLVASILNLTNTEVWCITEAYDHCLEEFTRLVEEWLELNYAIDKSNPAIIIRDMLIAAVGRRNVDVAGCNRVARELDQPIEVTTHAGRVDSWGR